MSDQTELPGPDLTAGVPESELADGAMLLGHAHGEPVLIARVGEAVHAISATCTHWSGPLAEGLLVDGQVRCPWHHACFDLATGEAVHAPALKPVSCFVVRREGGRVSVGDRIEIGADRGLLIHPSRKEAIEKVGQSPDRKNQQRLPIILVGEKFEENRYGENANERQAIREVQHTQEIRDAGFGFRISGFGFNLKGEIRLRLRFRFRFS